MIFSLLASICLFTPPAQWECALPKNDNPYIQIHFIGKKDSGFAPNLNLAIEKIDVPLKEYLKDVREIHELEMKVQWRDLGSFTFQSGRGRLTEITSSSSLGEIKTLQGILVQDGFAYILTGAALKKEFPQLQNQILSAIRSLTIAPDLFSLITDASLKSHLVQTFDRYAHIPPEERQNEWKNLQTLIKNYDSLGSYWTHLVLKEGHQRIFASSSGQKPSPQ